MTTRKDELARKLTEGEVPEPPKELLHRIKKEIPSQVPVMPAPERPERWWRAGWAVAASVLALVIMSYVMLRVMDSTGARMDAPLAEQVVAVSETEEETKESAVARKAAPAPLAASGEAPSKSQDEVQSIASGRAAALEDSSTRPAAPAAELQQSGQRDLDAVRANVQSKMRQESFVERRSQEAPPPSQPLRVAPSAAPPPPPPSLQDSVAAKSERADRGRGVTGREVGGVVGGVMAQAPAMQESASTGGSTEPNDAPYGDVFFKNYGVNPFVDTEDDRFSTFGLDVDTGSYTIARRYLRDGNLPPTASVRVEEFINYFQYGDAAPRSGDFAIRVEGAPAPFPVGERYKVLRIGIRGRNVEVTQRKPATLVFVVDVSGSMDRENRLALVKRALGLLLDQLRPDDEVGLVVYGSSGRVVLEPTSDLISIRKAIERLRAEGSTNAEEGLRLGYRLAGDHYRRNAINRIILCSDGVANVGRTGPDSILKEIEQQARRGIELSTIGFGMGNYNDVLMEQLADRGDGSYAYVDTIDEARRIFVENLTGTLQTIARNAKVQVEFNPDVVSRYRLIGYENRDVADARFRDDSVDAGEIGAGHSVTALYELKLAADAPSRALVGTVRMRYEAVDDSGRVREIEQPIPLSAFAAEWSRASSGLRLASLVAKWGEVLKGSYWAREVDLDELLRRAQRLSPQLEGDARAGEFVDLVRRTVQLKGER